MAASRASAHVRQIQAVLSGTLTSTDGTERKRAAAVMAAPAPTSNRHRLSKLRLYLDPLRHHSVKLGLQLPAIFVW